MLQVTHPIFQNIQDNNTNEFKNNFNNLLKKYSK